MNLEEVKKNARKAVLVGQNSTTGNNSNGATSKTPALNSGFATYNPLSMGYVPSIETVNIANGNAFAQNSLTNEVNKQLASKGFAAIAPYSSNNVVSAFDPKTLPNAKVVNKVQNAKNSNGGGSGGTSSIVPDYKASLDDLYNKVMGYGGYTPSTFSAGTYTPSVYSRTVDTSATEAALKNALGDIQGYEDFQYDLNGDLLYQQAVDNYAMLGQQAMADATANAAALTGGYGNSYAASVGNQVYQQYITQANNMIPQFQQMALNTWQSGLDRLMGVYDAVSQQLANELSLEDMAFSIWAQNEANAANAFSMNEANRFNAWAQNEQNAANAWQSGLDQLLGQYNITKDYYATLEAMQQASSSGGSSSGNKSSNNTGFWETTFDAVKNAAAQSAVLGSPYTSAQLIELIKQNQKK